MKTPKEKAKELVEKFRKEYEWVEKDFTIDLYRDSKQCALICVDEVIKTYTNKNATYWLLEEEVDYWQQVKTEIEKL